MPLERTLRLAIDPTASLEGAPLGPEEYFVLSRVEGTLTVKEIIAVSGLGAQATEAILETLLEVGVLRRVEGRAAGPVPTASSPMATPGPKRGTRELRVQAADRRRRLLQQQLAGAVGAAKARGTGSMPAASPTPPSTAAKPEPEPEPEPESQAPVVAPVPADDPRLDPALGLPFALQRSLLALQDRLGTLTPFELLGLAPTHDLKVIRDAFRDASRRFHPDAYHGRELGSFRPLLSTLFAKAKDAHAALQKEEVRHPLVAELEARKAEARRREQQREAARKAAEELRQRREREEAQHERAERAAERAAQRAERDKARLMAAARVQVAEYVQAAADAEAMENYARAANNYRLAMQIDPSDPTLRERWEHVRGIARRRRAKDAFARACTYVEVGHPDDAIGLFVEAAEADPTLEHLARAADAVRERDPAKARDLALEALRLLAEQERDENVVLRLSTIAEMRLMIGRAFLSAGQYQSAREQAQLVQRIRPNDPQARALLNSIKVT